MMTRRGILRSVLGSVTVSPILAACGGVAQPAAEQAIPAGKGSPARLRIGDLPLIDMLPLYVAEAEGLFAARGVAVELIPFSSAVERDAAYTARQIDGELNDFISATVLDRQEAFSKTIRVIIRSTAERSMFFILAAKNTAIAKPADLKGMEIAISHNTIIEYLVDKMLMAAGLAVLILSIITVGYGNYLSTS